MGRETANVYFNHVLNPGADGKSSHSLKLVIESSIIERESSVRKIKNGLKKKATAVNRE